MQDVYEILRTKKGAEYKAHQITKYSLIYTPLNQSDGIRGNSRVWGDVSEENRRIIIDKIISVGSRFHLNYKDIAYALLLCKAESGFNPDAAAGTTSAAGLAQYTKDTAKNFKVRSKQFLGIEIDMSGLKVFDVDVGVYGVIVAYLFNRSLADKWGFNPEDPKYWQLIYMLHHDGPGYYTDDRGKQRAIKFLWRKEAVNTYNRIIESSLEKLSMALSHSRVETRIKLLGSDGQPVINKDYVIAVPQNSSQQSPTTLSTNRQTEKKTYQVIQGKTDVDGFSLPIVSSIGNEMIALLLPRDYRELGVLPTGKKHKVKKGETLSQIAKKHHTTVDRIVKDNQVKDRDKITIGQELVIHSENKEHTVKKGESLENIAKRYHISIYELTEINKIKDKNLIYVGQELIIPKAETLENSESIHIQLKQLKHKPSNSAIRDIMELLGVPNFNLNAINFSINHTVKPKGSTTNSWDKTPNILEIKTPVAAQAINENKEYKSNQQPIKHATDKQGSQKEVLVKITDGCAVIYTYQDMDYAPRNEEPKKGYTVFYDHFGNKLFSMKSGSRVDSKSKAGADGPMSEVFTGIQGGYRKSRLGVAYGTTKILHTDKRLRWIHGGGGGDAQAYKERQPWRVTKGCTRAQNIDLENLAQKIREFQKQYPKVKIKCIRDKKATYPK